MIKIKNKLKNSKLKKGQILVVMLLVMLVGLTIGLFLLGRSSTDISLTTRTTDSTRAFNAAEAGIEQALFSIGSIVPGSPVPVASGTNYSVTRSDMIVGAGQVFPTTKQAPIGVGDVYTIWMIPHNADGTLNEAGAPVYRNNNISICFTDNTPHPAIGVTLYYRAGASTYRTSYAAYDPVRSRLTTTSINFNDIQDTTIGSCGGTNGYQHRAFITFNTDMGLNLNLILPIALRIRPLYAPASIAVIPQVATLPKQGDNISSTGTASETTRKIEVADPYKVPAPFLDSAIYSKTNLEK